MDKLSLDLYKIEKWFDRNKVSLNLSKTKKRVIWELERD